VSADHGVPGLRSPDHQRLALRPVQPRLPEGQTEPGTRPTRVAQPEQAGQGRAHSAVRVLVSRLRRSCARIDRPHARPRAAAGAGRRAARRDASALPRLQHAQALGADADAPRFAPRCEDRGWTKMTMWCGDLGRASTNERTTFAVLAQSWPRAMTDVERGLALLRAHAAYVDRVHACRGCDRPLQRKPGRGRDPRWCSPACRARFRRRQATFARQAPQGAHVPR